VSLGTVAGCGVRGVGPISGEVSGCLPCCGYRAESRLWQGWRPRQLAAPNYRLQATAYSLRFATLHFSFQPRLKRSVDMTSDVKGWEPLFLRLHSVFSPFIYRKSRSQ
jgi:hypothetical protein